MSLANFQVQKIETLPKSKQSGFVNEITKISKGEYINAKHNPPHSGKPIKCVIM